MDASETKLPENAHRPPKPGETYKPVVPPSAQLPEATWRSVLWGLFLCAIFTAASAYSGLKSARSWRPRSRSRSSPASRASTAGVRALGERHHHRRRRRLGSVVAGAIFTLPAYILKLDPHPWQTIFIRSRRWLPRRSLPHSAAALLRARHARRAAASGGHGDHRGARDGRRAARRPGCSCRRSISAVYDFFVTTFQVWKEMLDFQFVPVVHAIGEKARMVLKFDAISFILGLGYVMGLRLDLPWAACCPTSCSCP